MRKLLCIILFGLSLPGWAQTNVVANGGFEDPRNFLQGWDSVYGAGGLLVSPTAAEGRNFAMVTGNLYQDLPTVPGKVYRLRYAVARRSLLAGSDHAANVLGWKPRGLHDF